MLWSHTNYSSIYPRKVYMGIWLCLNVELHRQHSLVLINDIATYTYGTKATTQVWEQNMCKVCIAVKGLWEKVKSSIPLFLSFSFLFSNPYSRSHCKTLITSVLSIRKINMIVTKFEEYITLSYAEWKVLHILII